MLCWFGIINFEFAVLSVLCQTIYLEHAYSKRFRNVCCNRVYVVSIIAIKYPARKTRFLINLFIRYIYANQSSEYETSSILGGAIAWTIISVVFGLCILFLSAAINVIAFFFKQAHYAVFSMPLILLEPILVSNQSLFLQS